MPKASCIYGSQQAKNVFTANFFITLALKELHMNFNELGGVETVLILQSVSLDLLRQCTHPKAAGGWWRLAMVDRQRRAHRTEQNIAYFSLLPRTNASLVFAVPDPPLHTKRLTELRERRLVLVIVMVAVVGVVVRALDENFSNL